MAIQTNVVWNRELTTDEVASIGQQAAADVTAGQTDGIVQGGPANSADPIQRTWVTTEFADAWITFCNTYNPAPVSATVITT